MFIGELPSHVNRNSVRVAGGLGTIPRIVRRIPKSIGLG